jgi:hypothetical protein
MGISLVLEFCRLGGVKRNPTLSSRSRWVPLMVILSDVRVMSGANNWVNGVEGWIHTNYLACS